MDGRPARMGRYVLARRVASGGMSTVHLGRLVGPAGFGRTVAIKQLHPHLAGEAAFVAMLLDEARLAARIHHPNVVSMLDVVQEEEQLLLVMEYVHGVSLAELIARAAADGGALPPEVVSSIGCGVLAGLHAAHEAVDERGRPLGVVHRDVSPQNILVGADGVVRLADFGVARAAGRLQSTRSGQIKGKLAYMAPEQLRAGAVDRRADVYATALVLWEALTGRRPFGDAEEGALARVLSDVPPASGAAPGVPPALDEVLERALARAPERRTPTAERMGRELAAAVAPAPAAAVAATVAELAPDLLERRARLAAEAERADVPEAPDPGAARGRRAAAGAARGRRPRRVLLVAGVTTALALAAGFGVRRRQPAAPVALEVPAASPAAPAVEPAPAPEDVGVPAGPQAVPAVRPAPRPPAAARATPGGPGRKPVPPAQAARPAACDPPFTIGADGVKQYKIECL